MAKFIFAWHRDEDGNFLIISEKDYFELEGAINDSYDDDVAEELNVFFENIGCFEVADSAYEITTSVEDVEEELRSSGLFEKSKELADFLYSGSSDS